MRPNSLTAAALALGVSAAAANAAEMAAASKIDAVTVFPSGAEVTRLAKVKIVAGEHTLVFNDLPALAVPGSIRVEGKATGKLDIGSVDTRRLSVPRADAAAANAERKKIEDEIELLKDQRHVLEGALAAADTQRALIGNLAQLPTRPPLPAGTPGQGEDWAKVLATIGAGMADAQRLTSDTNVKIRTLDRHIEDLSRKLSSIAPAQQERTEVKVHLAAGAALDADVTVRYQVSGASWTPLYDARLATGTKQTPPKLELTRRASIQQRTGEVWSDVAVQLSTARPSSSAAAPDLAAMTVDFQPEAKPVAAAPPAPQAVAPTAGMADSRDALAEGALKKRAMEVARYERAVEQQAEVVVAPFQAVFAVPGRLSVPDTNEAKRVKLQDDALEPALSIRTTPKLDAKAFLYAKLVLPKGSPTLPGAVSLFRDGTFVGTGRLPLLSPGEDHELGFGADDLVRVKHAVAEDKRGETGIISTSRTDNRNYKITIKNLHERQMPVTVFDQVPVSKNQDIRVDAIGRAPTRQNVDDKRGVYAWDLKVEPDQEQTVEFGYRVTWPSARQIIYGR